MPNRNKQYLVGGFSPYPSEKYEKPSVEMMTGHGPWPWISGKKLAWPKRTP